MSIKKQTVFVLIIALFFLGCNSKSTYFTPFISKKIDLSKDRDTKIVHDIITIIKAYYPPATTVFEIEQTNSKFAKNIESELRKKGYGLDNRDEQGIKRVPLAWKITYLNKNMILVYYHIDDISISRVYQLKHNQYQPLSSFSAVGLDSRKFANLDFRIQKNIKTTHSFAKVTASSLKIRTKPTIKSKEIATLKRGESVSYSEIVMDNNGNEWIKLEGGGYMKASYLKF